MDRKAFGQGVYRLRMAAKMTQEQFSEAIGVSRTYLQSIEGGRSNPTIEVVRRVAKVCRCAWEDLLGKP